MTGDPLPPGVAGRFVFRRLAEALQVHLNAAAETLS